VSFSQYVSPWSHCVGHCNSPLSQSIGAIPASQDILLYILTRIERSFRLLEIHIEVPPTSVMVAIMVEVLSILATVTKEIKQGRTSESWQYTLFLSTYDCLEKYLKKLIGGSGVEDALSRLDRLTQTLTRTASKEHLKLIHGIGVDALKMPSVDDKGLENVQSVDDGVKNIAYIGSFLTDGAQFYFT